MKLKFKIYLRIFLFVILLLSLPRLGLMLYYQKLIVTPEQHLSLKPAEAALVFGAGLSRPGEPSLVLADRVSAAVDLLRDKKVETLILSGKKEPYYDEVKAMKNLALRLGVKEEQLLLDEKGYRSIDSCINAKQVFGKDKLILVTQRFHLPRSLFLCQKQNLEVQGLASDISFYKDESKIKWGFREFFACWRALWDIYT